MKLYKTYIGLSLKFHKDQSFRWGDIALTMYNLEDKIFGVFFSSWIIANELSICTLETVNLIILFVNLD